MTCDGCVMMSNKRIVDLFGTDDLVPKITPTRIDFFDQPQLPVAVPFFQGFLAGDRTFHGVVLFVPDECLDVVLGGESLDDSFAVLPDALNQVGGDADIERAVACTGHDVYGWVEFTLHGELAGFPPSRE